MATVGAFCAKRGGSSTASADGHKPRRWGGLATDLNEPGALAGEHLTTASDPQQRLSTRHGVAQAAPRDTSCNLSGMEQHGWADAGAGKLQIDPHYGARAPAPRIAWATERIAIGRSGQQNDRRTRGAFTARCYGLDRAARRLERHLRLATAPATNLSKLGVNVRWRPRPGQPGFCQPHRLVELLCRSASGDERSDARRAQTSTFCCKPAYSYRTPAEVRALLLSPGIVAELQPQPLQQSCCRLQNDSPTRRWAKTPAPRRAATA